MHQYSGVKKGYRPARTSRGYRSFILRGQNPTCDACGCVRAAPTGDSKGSAALSEDTVMNVGCDDMHTLSPRDGPLLTPHSTLWLPDDPSGTFARSSLWAVHIFRLLEPHETRALVALALEHAAANGWSTRRHKHHPTTDIAVERETAPALHGAVKPLVARVVLPTLALHYGFEQYSALIPLLQRQVLCVDTTASTPSTLR